MFCPKCGGKIKEDNKFCPLCGAELAGFLPKTAAEAEVKPAAPAQESAPAQPAAPAPAQDKAPEQSAAPVQQPTQSAAPVQPAAPANQPTQSAAPVQPAAPANQPTQPAAPAQSTQPTAHAKQQPTQPAAGSNSGSGKKVIGLIIGIVAAVVVIAAIVGAVIFFGNKDDDDDKRADKDKTEDVDDKDDDKDAEPTEEPVVEVTEAPTPEPTPEPTPAPAELIVKAYSANNFFSEGASYNLTGTNVFVYEGTNTEGEPDYTARAEDGTVSIHDMEAGEYTVICERDGYYMQEQTVSLEEGDTVDVSFYMLAELADEKAAYVYLTWEGDQDLDLCLFNSKWKQYVTIETPKDGADEFVYGDNNAAIGFEMLYIPDITASVSRTVYVVDPKAIREGVESGMENDGLRIRVITSSGVIYDEIADDEKTSPLFIPFYIYGGEIRTDVGDRYMYDMSNYGWTKEYEKR